MKIGITYRFAKDPTGKRNRLYIPEEFQSLFDEMGVTLIPLVSYAGIDDLIALCDGLILPGSYADVHPSIYGEEPIEGKNYDVDEYTYDSYILEKFLKQNKPILGICGGHQEINVYFGGTLYQMIDNHLLDNLHKVHLNDSRLKNIYQKEELEVNSFHHQAIKDVAPGFQVSAISDDGIIEAIEKDNILCVQWHPEVMRDKAFFQDFFSRMK